MSEATIFEFPYNLFLKQRMEFVVISHDHLAAGIMRIVEYEMTKLKEAWQDKVALAINANKTPPKEPKEYWVRLSQGQIIAKLYRYDSEKIKKPEKPEEETEEYLAQMEEYLAKKALSLSRSTLRKAINDLIEKGFLLMRSKPGDEFGAPLYTLHRENVQKAIKALPANPFTIFNMWGGVTNSETGGESQNLQLPPENSETGESQDLEVGVTEFETGDFQNLEVFKDITKDIHQDKQEECESNGAIAHTPPTISQESENHGNTDTDHLPLRSTPPLQHQQDDRGEQCGAAPDIRRTQGAERDNAGDEREGRNSGATSPSGVRRGETNNLHRHEGIARVTQEISSGASVGLYESHPLAYSPANCGSTERGGEEGVYDHHSARRDHRSGAVARIQPPQGRAQKSAGQRSDPLDSLPEGVKAIILEWQQFNGPCSINGKLLEHTATLIKSNIAPGEIAGCAQWQLDNDKKKVFQTRPIYLGDVVNGLASYRRVYSAPQKKKAPPPLSPPPTDDPAYQAMLEKCRQIKQKEREIANAKAKK
jgi:hypothetical protein